MKQIYKIIIFIFLLVVYPFIVFAESNSGLSLMADKIVYAANEEIHVKVKFSNDNDLENVLLQVQAPEGYEVISGNAETKQYDALKAGQEGELEVVYRAQGVAPVTGNIQNLQESNASENNYNASIVIGILAVIIIAIIVVIIMKGKHRNQILSFFICVMIGGMALQVSALTNRQEIKTELQVDGKPVVIQASVTYETVDAKTSNKESLPSQENTNVNNTQGINHKTEKYEIRFESNGGTYITWKRVNRGERMTAPPTPRKNGYAFVNWYRDKNLKEIYDFNEPIQSDMILYAKWKKDDSKQLKKSQSPTYGEELYWKNAQEIIDIIDVSESENVLTEQQAIAFFEERGFVGVPVMHEYDIDGDYHFPIEASRDSNEKHPVYTIEYTTKNNIFFKIYLKNGMFTASPLWQPTEEEIKLLEEGKIEQIERILSESEQMTGYDGEANKYFVTIPKATEVILRVVPHFDAETLNRLTSTDILKKEVIQ